MTFVLKDRLLPKDLLEARELPSHFRLDVGGKLGQVFFDKVGHERYTASTPDGAQWLRENIPTEDTKAMIKFAYQNKPERILKMLGASPH